MNALEGLSRHTTVVADTGDVALIAHHRPQDATTNPSLILKAVGLDDYKHWIQDIAAEAGRVNHSLEDRLDALLVKFGKAILEVIPGRVSTEIDARLSFDAQASFKRAMHIAERYHALGVHRDRFLIKIAATWEGLETAGRLEREGVHCNLTLVFSLSQSIACAEAGVRLISPFVGRIYDWYQKNSSMLPPESSLRSKQDSLVDPGVASVRRIYRYVRRHGYATEVMGASFRHTGQILALAGCDLLTISPELLSALQALPAEGLDLSWRDDHHDTAHEPIQLSESAFRWAMNEDIMANEKLAEGIRNFAIDTRKLEALLS